MQRPQHHGCTGDRGFVIAIAEQREEVAQGREQDHQVTDVTDPGTDPVTPGGIETQVFTAQRTGIGKYAVVQRRLTVGQGLIDQGQRQHADAGDQPPNQDRASARTGRHVLWQAENAAADHRADHQGDQQTQRQALGFNLVQTARNGLGRRRGDRLGAL